MSALQMTVDTITAAARHRRTQALRRTWDGRVGTWEHHVFSSPGFERIRDELLVAASAAPTDRCVDLGAGSGFVTVALAPRVGHVTAVDLAPAMLAGLEREVQRRGITNVATTVADLAGFTLAPASVDVVVSNYALHHLTDEAKRSLVLRAARWLRPDGRIVITDMMFGRGASVRDRRILRTKASTMVRRGPAGIWRLLKNVVRFGLRVGTERPASPDFWVAVLREAGLREVSYRPLVAEAGLVSAVAPPLAGPQVQADHNDADR